MMDKYGFYIVKDEFFQKFNDPFLKGNKEGNRPHYYCFQDEQPGLYWLIPMSSRTDKYQKIIQKRRQQNKACDILHVCKLSNDKVNAFLIQDMFPITENYIERPYTFAGNQLILINETERKNIEQKARRVLNLLNRGVKLNPTQPNVLSIKLSLLSELEQIECDRANV